MKKFILILIVLLSSFNAYAADDLAGKNSINLSPLQSYFGLKLKYEREFSNRYTGGSFFSYYYHLFYGVQAEPFLRFYFKKTAPKGIYLQAKISSGFYVRDYQAHLFDEKGEPKKDVNDNFIVELKKTKFPYSAIGLAFGGQVFFGADKRWSFDSNIGFRYSQELPSLPNDAVHHQHGPIYTELFWLFFGPNSLIDGTLSLGYRF